MPINLINVLSQDIGCFLAQNGLNHIFRGVKHHGNLFAALESKVDYVQSILNKNLINLILRVVTESDDSLVNTSDLKCALIALLFLDFKYLK